MFSKISKEDFSWSRSKRALPIFLLLWGGGLILAVIYLAGVRVHLHSIERAETENLLDSYLAAHRGSNPYLGNFIRHHKQLPLKISFVRFVRGSDQMLVVGEDFNSLSFEALAGISPQLTGVWVKLNGERDFQHDIQTIVTRTLDSGTLIQIGKEAKSGYQLYRKLRKNTYFFVITTIFFIWPLSLIIVKHSLSPMTSTRRKLSELADSSTNGSSELLPETGNGPEINSLYRQINQLLLQNRHLVAEMQQSLDNVAHDLRTPMTRLRSVAEYGLQAEDDSDRLREALSDCLEESERVLAMLRIMMSVAEAEAGTMILEIARTNLLKSLEQVVTLYEYVALEAGISVSLEVDEDISVEMDNTRMGQVWANLLDNAIKYGKEGGRVQIYAGVDDNTLHVYFDDDGSGISETEQERIWERLYRGDRSRSKKGLGLGLNYAQAVAAAHGGKITVHSNLHQGSCFTVHFPLAQLRTQEKSQTSGEWSESRTSGM